MTIKGSQHTKTMKRFQIAFKKWFDGAGMSQIEASSLFDISHTLISKLLKNKASVSIAIAERIADEIGTDLPEMLIEGRELLGEKSRKINEKEDPHQREKDAFEYVLIHGGEGAEVLVKAIVDLAKKKQAEIEDPTIRQGYKSAS